MPPLRSVMTRHLQTRTAVAHTSLGDLWDTGHATSLNFLRAIVQRSVQNVV